MEVNITFLFVLSCSDALDIFTGNFSSEWSFTNSSCYYLFTFCREGGCRDQRSSRLQKESVSAVMKLTFLRGGLAINVGLELERNLVLCELSVRRHGESSGDHLGVGEQNAAEGKASSLDRVFVHLYLLIIIISY